MEVSATTPSWQPGPELDRAIRHAWGTLLDRSDSIADTIVLALLDGENAWYDQADPALRAEVRESTREHVRRGLRTMAGLAAPDERAVHVWRETGRRRAQQGVPMEVTLNAYSLGTRVLWEALLSQRDRPDLAIDDHVLLTAGRQVWAALDVQNATLVDAYRREAARLQRQDLHRQQRLLDGLTEGRAADGGFLGEVRQVLGLAVDDRVACVVGRFDGGSEGPLRSPEEHLERLERQSFWHVRGDLHFGIVRLAEGGVDELVEALRPVTSGRVGVAASRGGLPGFATAYRLAAGAVETLPRGEPAVVAATDRLPEVLLSETPEVTDLLVQETLGPLLALPEHQARTLMDTLRALIAHHGSPTHAAEELFCHRNTVLYRMRQIAGITGRDLGDARDRLLFSLALLATASRR